MAKRKAVTRGDDPLVLPVAQLKRRCTEGNSAQLATASADDSGHVEEASCCSSNNSVSGLQQERVGNVDLVHGIHGENVEEVETITCDLEDEYRRNTTNSSESFSGEMDPPEQNSRPPPSKMPPKDEIEKFFAAVENKNQKYYTDKYNYDFAKDVPLEGRYEWVLIKP